MASFTVATLNIWNRFGPWEERLVAIREGLRALSPEHFVAVRTVLGGPAPEQVADFLRRQKERAAADQQWLKAKNALLAAFPEKIEREKARLLA